MISQTIEYALRAIVTLAQHEGKTCTAQQISQITQVPAPYLSKLMQVLVRNGLANSQRGLHGGFSLARDPAETSVLDIVNAVEPIRRIQECPVSVPSHAEQLCPLHRLLDDAVAMVEQLFRETTIADILADFEGVTPLCAVEQFVMIGAKNSQNHSAKANQLAYRSVEPRWLEESTPGRQVLALQKE
jgi:Rrf2 family transcriptional regulator, nitric oxide-sensitive transcriptional repressor